MTKVIKFPNDSFRKNSRQVLALSSDKNKFTIIISIFTLVLALSIFNNKAEHGSSNPTRGMRGLASVDQSQFNIDNEKIIKLIESKNSRRIARLGRNPSAADDFSFSQKILHNYLVSKDAKTGLVSEVYLARVKENTINTGDRDRAIFFDNFIENQVGVFGATKANCGVAEEVSSTSEKIAEDLRLHNRYCDLKLNGVSFSRLAVRLTNSGHLIDLKVQRSMSSKQ